MKTSRFHKTFGLFQAVVIIASMVAVLVCAQPSMAQAGVPVFRPETLAYASFQEDATNNGQVIADDTDGPSLTYSVVTQPAHGYLLSFNASTGAFTYRGDGDYNGADTFRVRVTDGTNPVEADVSVTLQPVEDAPVALDDGVYTLAPATYAWLDAQTGGTAQTWSTTGDYTGMLKEDINPGFLMPYFNGLYDRVRLWSNGSVELYNSTGTDQVNINVLFGLDANRFTAIVPLGGSKYVNKSTTTVYTRATVSGSQFVIQFNNVLDNLVSGQPSTYEVVLNSSGVITIQYQNLRGFVDGVGLASPYFHKKNMAGNHVSGVYINRALLPRAVNAAYTFTPIQPYMADYNTGFTASTAIGANDFDPDGSLTGTRSLRQAPEHGTLTLNGDGTFSYTPATNYIGRDRFTYRITQPDGRYMDADAHIYVRNTGLSNGGFTNTAIRIWALGTGKGYIQGYDHLARPFRYKVTTSGYIFSPIYFFPGNGSYGIFAQSTGSSNWTGAIETQSGTTSNVTVTVSTATGTIVSGDGIYTVTPTQYTSGTQPWDELAGDSAAVDLAPQLTDSNNQDEHQFDVSLGFTLPFLHETYTHVFPNTNGFLSFGKISQTMIAMGKGGLPRWELFSNLQMFGMDGTITPSGSPAAHIYYRTFTDGSGNPLRFVIEYVNMRNYNATSEVSTFEAVLYPSGNIEVRYRTLGSTPDVIGLEYMPEYDEADGDLPAAFGINYKYYSLANYLTLTYQPGGNYAAEGGTPLVVDTAHGVRANDFSATSGGTDTPTLSVKRQPTHGTLTLNNNGSFTYTPTTGFGGTDYFVYSAALNSITDSNLVAIDVTNTAPQPPVINSVTGATTVYDGNTVTLNINATDANGDALDYSYTLSGGGTLSGASINPDTGVFTWPNSVEGTYEVTFRAFQENDPAQYDDSDPVTITVNHNNPPVFDTPTGSLSADEGSTLSFTLNAHDNEGDGLSYSMISGPSTAIFNPTTRAFSWLTGEADDGTHDVTFRVAETNTPTRWTEHTYTLTVNEIAEPPIIDAPTGNLTINEGATFNITINAHDADNDPLTYSMISTTSGGTFNAATHVFTWATGEANNGSYTATFRVAETATPTRYDEETYTLTVNEVNQAPTITRIDGPTSVLEETAVTLTVVASDADIPANTLSYSLTGLPSGATFSATTGVLNWSSAVTGTYPMTFTVHDNYSGGDLTGSQAFTLTVTGNQPPVMDGLTGDITLNEGGTFNITVNAHDPEGDALTYSNPSHPTGSTFNASTHVFTWTTAEVDSGTHSVTFRVAETAHPTRYDEETYTLTVNEVNQAPTITSITGPTSVLEGTNVQLSVNVSDPDVPANAFSYTVTGEPSGATINHSTGVLTYNNAAVGVYHMTFTATDDGTPPLSGTSDFTLTVNANTAPVIDSISTGRTVNEGSDMTITVTAHDNESDPLTYTASGLPGGANSGWSSNSFTWHTTEAENGSYQVTFRVAETNHPTRFAEQTVTLTVNEINEAPTITGITGPTSAGEGSNITLTVNATDADTPGSMTYAVSGAPSGSTFNTGTGVLTYNNAVTGSYPMTFTVHDHGTPDMTDTEAFTLTITDVDFMPQVTDVTGTRTINEGQTFHLTVVASDRDNDTLTYSVASGLPAGASPTWTGNQFTWVTTEAHNGTHHVTFRATETAHPTHYGELTVDLVVNEINEPPTITSISGPTSIPESQPVTLTVNATDADTPSLMTYEVSGAPAGSSFNASTGVFSWGSAVQGVYNMTFTVHDHDASGDLTDTEAFTLTVTDVDHLPEITSIDGSTTVNEGSIITLTVVASDGDNDPLVYSMTSGPAGSTFNPTTHIFTWATTEADNGPHSVTFHVAETTHAYHYAEQTVPLTVNEINEAPSITSITGPSAITEGHAVSLTVHATDADTPGSLSYSVSYPGSTPVGATLNASTGVWSWTVPTPGTYDLAFTVHDNDPAGDMTDTETFTLSVSQYQLPVIDSITGTTTLNEGTPLNLTVAAHDPENGTLSYDVLGLPGGASSIWVGNVFTWNTVETDGPHTFTLTIRVTADNNPARRATQDVTVTVNEVNRTPVLNLIGYTDHGEWVSELEAASFVIGATDPDVPANTLSYSMTGAPAGATLDPATGAFLWTPTHAQASHDYTFKVRVADAGGMYDESNITLKVNARPLFTTAPATVNGVINRPVGFTVAAQDPDVRPGALTYAVVGSLPAGASFDPATRTFTWTPTGAQTGSFGIVLSVTDGLATVETTVTVRIEIAFFRYLPLLIGY